MTNKEIIIICNTMEGEGWTEEETKDGLDNVNTLEKQISEKGINVTTYFVSTSKELERYLKKHDPANTVVFNWCEELDGMKNSFHLAPQLLEKIGFVYTGNDPENLQFTLDKIKVKNTLIKEKLSTPAYNVYTSLDEKINHWNVFPALVKPALEHSSYGITKESVVDNHEQLEMQVKKVIETFNGPAYVEDFIDGTEFNIAVWGNDNLEILPIRAIDYKEFEDYHDRLCNYDSKWILDSDAYKKTQPYFVRDLDLKLKKNLEKLVIRTYRVLNCKDYARIDIRMRDGNPYILDVNSNPDITENGGFAQSAMDTGVNYGGVIIKLCEIALDRVESYQYTSIKTNPLYYNSN
ncbi:hypothetical protein A3F07_01955 [candidate division WWE3 bacterium RIFCSPHIGHO2_12_FULL_38_15]|uniref:ATP-grasp domain-containing protein n=1 Tax=candidate division WWE3 bacterium RIFCSPHIGHO2_02_FULL_38_14 TaxID=1802620 RepID=A0A1F4V8E7_UNCKA|nr:MAG: hypothetical protein A2793_03190 [candidate division WWE3 bacterium RIFCSPHIGHO2_01_FULL_38_45]OGC48645.1 MAG: hypothetical protein A3F07_01955 [candidate division WWE3 bacterium RIFCSPHIGHO2_12_FULL_38_15]OGC53051.1 MAG: hypothetical protein A3B64_01215 [candidate division WWE3 bacterium RIFCSPLOWO2_01_FULL_37_24]OGC53414.1 MAG: hypothetical protein A3D91_00070 [candidate division WWE3 bacterium RIFCSPHIGHO2_02_FULL_38_14]HLB51888.1 hypothetical protein [Patescibacteria group bacterium